MIFEATNSDRDAVIILSQVACIYKGRNNNVTLILFKADSEPLRIEYYTDESRDEDYKKLKDALKSFLYSGKVF